MIKTIKVDKVNYFADSETKDRIPIYLEGNPNLVFYMKMEDKSSLIVPGDKISLKYGGQISFDYNGDRYFVDDGYRDTLIKAGYLVYNDYDNPDNHITDPDFGLNLRNEIRDTIDQNLSNLDVKITEMNWTNSDISFKFQDEKGIFEYTVYISTVNSIVNKNQQRKLNELPFYPFDKNMDKYGTFYISVFCKKMTLFKVDLKTKYDLPNQFIKDLVNQMNSSVNDDGNEFHFVSLPIKRKLINWKGI